MPGHSTGEKPHGKKAQVEGPSSTKASATSCFFPRADRKVLIWSLDVSDPGTMHATCNPNSMVQLADLPAATLGRASKLLT